MSENLTSETDSLIASIEKWVRSEHRLFTSITPTLDRGSDILNFVHSALGDLDQRIEPLVQNLTAILAANHTDELQSALDIINSLRAHNMQWLDFIYELKYGIINAIQHYIRAHYSNSSRKRMQFRAHLEEIRFMVNMLSADTVQKVFKERARKLRSSVLRFVVWVTMFVGIVLFIAAFYPRFIVLIARSLLYIAGSDI